MRAAVAIAQDPDNPLDCLRVREVPLPEAPEGWVRVQVKASSLNQHDLWTLRGVGHDPENIPIVLGCDVAGVTEDGREVILHPVIADPDAGAGDETLDPRRALLSERHDGGFAEYIAVPERCLIDKPKHLSFEEAACLPVAWGTAFRMLFGRAQAKPGESVLVQGAGGGVTSAAIALAAAAGLRVFVTSRSEEKRLQALELGAAAVFASGERLPERVDYIVETVGEATWAHSLKCLKPGGAVVVCGATTGFDPSADLARVFYQQLRVLGSTGSTLEESRAVARFVELKGLRPRIDRTLDLEQIGDGFAAMADGDLNGKIVVTI
ncbi:zinc-binding dehydrogenase [Zhihengliuella salsuginis]|uniref:zinc-binding dehydrogenase n=1 Tax=Zhihengliuella salsuginis TaxID=578222 RepID=UPI0016791D5B|nr:zinc-binding dehydrogenase [Zhihengliuella salsuginis]